MAELSPMMKQYFETKKKYPDTILMFRLGDFYEMFFDDAVTASRELELVLTGRACGQEERAPMCGVPFHSADSYMARLVAKGYKVAICEQMEDPALAKGLVKREVVRVLTPGTVIENSMLNEGRNNFLASVYFTGESAGVCFIDVSTGSVNPTELAAPALPDKIINEIGRFMPSEIVFNSASSSLTKVFSFISNKTEALAQELGDNYFDPQSSAEIILKHFKKTVSPSLNSTRRARLFRHLELRLNISPKFSATILKTYLRYRSIRNSISCASMLRLCATSK